MTYINDWMTPPPIRTAPPTSPPPAASAPENPAKKLTRDIHQQIMSVASPDQPVEVHFYLGEGLRWIRVGFEGQALVKPAAVARVGRAIKSCVAPAETVYFHALRPHDLLYFLEDGKSKSNQVGMGPGSYGAALDTVLKAWREASI